MILRDHPRQTADDDAQPKGFNVSDYAQGLIRAREGESACSQ